MVTDVREWHGSKRYHRRRLVVVVRCGARREQIYKRTPLPRRSLRVIYGAERYTALLSYWRRSRRLKGLVPLLIVHTHTRT